VITTSQIRYMHGRGWTQANEAYEESALLEDQGGSSKYLDLSIVIPLLNEEDNVNLLYQSLDGVLKDLGQSAEIIFIDDGSSDSTFSHLKRIQQIDERVLVIRFRRNFGQTAAFSAGIDYARGKVIITIDGDMQNDPADIPHLLKKIEEGYDIVSGWRVNRQDAYLLRKFPSRIANWIISRVTGVRLHDYGCSLKAYRQEVLKNLRLYGEMHRFIPALASWMGIQVAEIPVNHHPRKYGQSKYGLGRTIKVILDLVTVKFLLDYATRPIHIFGFLGMLSFLIGSGLGMYLAVLRIFFQQPLGDRPILLLAVLLVVLGVQLLTMGLMGEMIIRTYHETQGKPIYMIRDLMGAHYRKVDREQNNPVDH
jgi:glycosyltransferase involved in cell wall biosynthesis